ncbi:MAG TPA: VOC family protein [Gammaproteobacteria bacterium]|nr:VOC family protein [Gammaproteobacteria bacterium]
MAESQVQLGHIVFYVTALEPSLAFYRDVVGLRECGRLFDGRGVMLTGGRTHHELLLIEVGDQPGPLRGPRRGLYHAGWRVGDSLDVLRDKYRLLQEGGYTITGMSDHTVSQSIYAEDPDGNEIELYVDNPDYDWRANPDWATLPMRPLKL